MKKLAILFATFICFAMISGSFAATNQNKEKIDDLMLFHKLVIVVPNNPSTGSHWVSNYDHNYVILASKIYIPSYSGIFHPLGVGGYDIYTFKGLIGQKITLKHLNSSGNVLETKNYIIC